VEDNVTEWTELTVCEAVRPSQDRAARSRTVFDPNRCWPTDEKKN